MITDVISKPEVIWFIIGFVCFLFELMVPGFFMFFFGLGACVTAIVCLIGSPSINLQIIIFAVISVLSLLTFRKMLHKKFFSSENDMSKSIEDEFTGKEAVAITDFNEMYRGKVEFKGTTWQAEAGELVKKGQIVKIIDKTGFILKVELKK